MFVILTIKSHHASFAIFVTLDNLLKNLDLFYVLTHPLLTSRFTTSSPPLSKLNSFLVADINLVDTDWIAHVKNDSRNTADLDRFNINFLS